MQNPSDNHICRMHVDKEDGWFRYHYRHTHRHICRGNFRSTWFSSGGYEPVAKTLFGNCNVDAFFLEYDSDRAGDFSPLRLVQN